MFRLRAKWRYLVTNRRYYFLRTIREYPHRAKHGWAPSDTWSLDYYMATVISESVRYLARDVIGYPGYAIGNGPYEDASTPEKWEEILRVIADGMERARDHLTSEVYDPDHDEKIHQSADLALDLFRKWFFCLWN